MSRFNIYDLPHRALRNALSQFNIQLGNTQFHDEMELNRLKLNLLRLMSLLSSHSYIEDSQLLKRLEEKKVPEIVKDHEDHHKLDEMLFDLSKKLQQLSHENKDAPEIGREIYLLFNRFHGEYLLHMHYEETTTLPLVWTHLNDDELAEIRTVIMEKTPAKIMQDWYFYCLPAFPQHVRVFLLKDLQMHYPQLYPNTLDTASRALDNSDFDALLKAIS